MRTGGGETQYECTQDPSEDYLSAPPGSKELASTDAVISGGAHTNISLPMSTNTNACRTTREHRTTPCLDHTCPSGV